MGIFDIFKSKSQNISAFESRYLFLISRILASSSTLKIIDKTSNSITIAERDALTYLEYHLVTVESDIEITLTIMANSNNNKERLFWKYNQMENQGLIVYQINSGLQQLVNRLSSK